MSNQTSSFAESGQPENFVLWDRINAPLAEPEMIFTDLWPAGTIALFTGDGGLGKTHWTLQLMFVIAAGGKIDGTPFHCPTPRPVVYISQEDDADFLRGELVSQFPDLRSRQDVASRIRFISTAVQGPTLFLTQRRSRDYLMQNIPEGAVFIVDSYSTILTSNESDNTQLLQNEIKFLKDIMKARKATALLIHHRPKPNSMTGQQSSYRGGTALPNSCRFHIMLSANGGRVRLTFEKVSRGAKPAHIDLIFDEERRFFVPKRLDRYVSAFKLGEELTTSEFMQRINKDPENEKERNQALDILRQRTKAGLIEKIGDGKKSEEARWKRKSDAEEGDL
jgi:hypothetical protein